MPLAAPSVIYAPPATSRTAAAVISPPANAPVDPASRGFVKPAAVPAVKASITIGSGNAQIVITAKHAGSQGNSIRVESDTPAAGETYPDGTFEYYVPEEPGEQGYPSIYFIPRTTSTAAQMVTYLNANAYFASVAVATFGGDGSGVFDTVIGQTAMTGGTGVNPPAAITPA